MSLNIPLIRASFEEVKPVADEVVGHFYTVLFETYPEVKTLFQDVDFPLQKKALIGSLSYIVDCLDDQGKLVDYLKSMGGRHYRYNVKQKHYEMVGKSLITTFKYYFGSNWTPELSDQWVRAYGIIADCMLLGAEEESRKTVSAPTFKPNQNIGMHTQNTDISEVARNLAKNILMQALEKECGGEFYAMAKRHVDQILRQALHEQAEKLESQLKKAA